METDPHYGNTLWLPLCELFTHVEADPSALRDGEKNRDGRDGGRRETHTHKHQHPACEKGRGGMGFF